MVSRFSAGRRNSTRSSSRTRLSKNACIWCCEAALGALGHRERQRARGRQLEPFIAHQQHRLREVERGKAGIDRKGDDAVGERDLLVLQAVALAAEQDADLAAAGDAGHDLARGGLRRHHRLGLIVGARGGGKQQRAVGDRLLDGVEQLDPIQDMVGAGGGALRADIGPAVARIDDAQAASARNCPSRARPCRCSRRAAARPESRRARRARRRIWSCRCPNRIHLLQLDLCPTSRLADRHVLIGGFLKQK